MSDPPWLCFNLLADHQPLSNQMEVMIVVGGQCYIVASISGLGLYIWFHTLILRFAPYFTIYIMPELCVTSDIAENNESINLLLDNC